ncbi:MAG: hypothetical protein H7Y03_14105 [Chitinophagaceae bacterium]|nr:hypothetical protein [Chitinophagaceae bacterium]
MLKLKELKEGDYVIAEYDGQRVEGIVKDMHRDYDNQVCVETPVQKFWFNRENLSGIPVTDEQLLKLGFKKQENEDGSVKYMKGAFRIVTPLKGDFSHMEIWYREDHRHLTSGIFVHELQHHHLDMTKVDLLRDEPIRQS